MNIKTAVEKITPNKALEYIATVAKEKQRKLKQRKVDEYATAMGHGHWLLTHQGIAFDDEGSLCDGQHRLHAVVRSGVTIETLVTRNISQKQTDMFTFDAIDQGAKRSISEQINVRYGVPNSNQTAAAARKIVLLCTGTGYAMTVATTMAVLDHYRKPIEQCRHLLTSTHGMLRAPILGSAAFCIGAGGAPVEKFIESVGSGENLSRGNPALTFRQYALNMKQAGGSLGLLERAFCLCAMHAMLGSEIRQIKSTRRGIDFFCDKQPRIVKAIGEMFTV